MKTTLNKKILLLLSTTISTLLSVTALAENRNITAKIFPLGKTTGEPAFIQETVIENVESEKKQWSSKIKDPKGVIVMTEKATIEGLRVTYQYVEQLQTNEAYELKVEGNQATFKTFKIKDGKAGAATETNVVTVDKDFLMGPSSEFFLKKNWDTLVAGKSVSADFGIFELSRTVGFDFKKTQDSAESIVIRMKPGNMFISALVNPIYMEFDKKTKQMVYFKGRTPLREFIDKKWKPMDAEIQYQ